MSRGLQAAAAAWLASGRTAVLVELLATRGSVPREAGTRMLVAADATLGTIGGGHLEWQAIAEARQRLASGSGLPWDWSVALGPSLGQCCGGAVQMRLRRLTPDCLLDWPPPVPRFHLQLHGAGHVGQALVRLLADLPCQVVWVDEREAAFAGATQAPHIEQRVVASAEAEVATAGPGTCYLVMSHSHELDQRITEAVLRRSDIGFLGLIGSQTKRARFLQRLAQRGYAAEALARLQCPIGLPGLRGKEPEVIAISILAQLLLASGN